MGVSSRLDIPASSKMKTVIILLLGVAIAHASTLERKGKMGKTTTEATEVREGSEEDVDVNDEDAAGKGKGKGKRDPKTTTEATVDRKGKMGKTTTEASVERRGKMGKTTTEATDVREGSEEDVDVNDEDAAGKGKG